MWNYNQYIIMTNVELALLFLVLWLAMTFILLALIISYDYKRDKWVLTLDEQDRHKYYELLSSFKYWKRCY